MLGVQLTVSKLLPHILLMEQSAFLISAPNVIIQWVWREIVIYTYSSKLCYNTIFFLFTNLAHWIIVCILDAGCPEWFRLRLWSKMKVINTRTIPATFLTWCHSISISVSVDAWGIDTYSVRQMLNSTVVRVQRYLSPAHRLIKTVRMQSAHCR